MTQPQQRTAAPDHARHDPALIAAYADRDRDQVAADRSIAAERIASCERCRDLFADLVLVRDALLASGTPVRPRDFTLTAADARRLAPRGWRRVVGFFGSARDGLSRPLAIGFTTIGLVALVVTTTPFMFLAGGGQSAAAPVQSTVGNAVGGAGGASAAPAAAASTEATRAAAGEAASPAASAAAASLEASAAPAPAASASDDGRSIAGAPPSASGGDSGAVFNGSNDTDNAYGDGDTDELKAAPSPDATQVSSGPSLGIVVSGICLLIGIGLFALRWTSRRIGNA